MDNINNYLTSLHDDLLNLIHDDIQPYFSDYKKINVYNNNIKIPAQKIWIETPKLKMTGKLYLSNKQKQCGLLSLLLYELDPEIEKFKLFIENIEDKIFQIVDEISNKSLIFKSSIKHSDNYYPTLSIQLPLIKGNDDTEFLFNIYDSNNKQTSYEQLISGSFIKSFIELSDIWMNSLEFGLNWKVLQMKIYPEFNFKKCLFLNDTNDKIIKNSNKEPKSQSPSIFPKKLKLHITKENLKFVPTINELLKMKNNLKKTENQNDNISNESKENIKDEFKENIYNEFKENIEDEFKENIEDEFKENIKAEFKNNLKSESITYPEKNLRSETPSDNFIKKKINTKKKKIILRNKI